MASIAIFSRENETHRELVRLLGEARVQIGIEMSDYKKILEYVDQLASIGITHAVVAAEFGTRKVGVQDGSIICTKIRSETNVMPIGIIKSGYGYLGGAMMCYEENRLPDLVRFLANSAL